MRHRHAISDDDWDRVKDLLPGRAGQPGVRAKDNRPFLDAVLWIAKTGAPWRDLPEASGPWGTAWDLFDRWNADGTRETILSRLRSARIDAGEVDAELWCVGGTVARAARCAAGGGRRTIPRSRRTMRWAAPAGVTRPRSLCGAPAMATRCTSP